jgi:predicted ribosomally synthesized peptide with SipW-like signal peptide
MLKKVLKSVLVLSLVLATGVGASRAYFTSTVTAADNEVTTGTLLLALDSAEDDSYTGTGYVVAVQNEDGSMNQLDDFPAWENAEPGKTESVYVAVRNKGTLPFNFRTMVSGEWVWKSSPRHGVSGSGCSYDHITSHNGLVYLDSVYRFGNGNCDGEAGCRNIRDWLEGLGNGWTMKSVSANTFNNISGYFEDGFASSATLDAKEFVVYRYDLKLKEKTDDCFQGSTYQYDVLSEAIQEEDNF